MALVTEIGPDLYRICVHNRDLDLQFNHFLVLDDEPLLFHTGYRATFPDVYDALRTVIDPARLRWIGFSHFESDECGSLNEWLLRAPRAQPLCSMVGALVSVNDFASRPARGMTDGETFETGRRTFRFVCTPHLPHGWDAGMLFEETGRTLFCSDLFHQFGDPEPLTSAGVADRFPHTLARIQASPLADYMPYTHNTAGILGKLADLAPRTLAIQHGSSYTGDGAAQLRELTGVMRALLGPPAAAGA